MIVNDVASEFWGGVVAKWICDGALLQMPEPALKNPGLVARRGTREPGKGPERPWP